ncbi:MAG: hypothetical protein EA360_11025, partial [Balneolaceae bacterium]
DILEFVSEEELAILEDTLGVTIYRGNNPPRLNVSFKVAPLLLTKTNVPGDVSLGTRYADMYMKLYDQNDREFTIEVDYLQMNYDTGEIVSTSTGLGSYVIGSGNGFSIFAKIETVSHGDETLMLQLFSGRLVSNGIADFQTAILMLENYGSSRFIPNGTGRAFSDGDNLSDFDSFPSSKVFHTEEHPERNRAQNKDYQKLIPSIFDIN